MGGLQSVLNFRFGAICAGTCMGAFVINLRLCLLEWQPVTFNRAVGYLLSKYRRGLYTGLETCRCARGNDLLHRH